MCRRRKIIWCDQEDKIMADLVSKTDKPDWGKIALDLQKKYGYKKKTNRQCRQRWHNILNPGIIKNQWTQQEQDILFEQHRLVGNKWALIATKLPGRTDNFIKNHFYSVIRKSLRRINKFLGSRDGTAKIKKIKPSALSRVFSLENQKQLPKLNFYGERSLISDQYQGKDAAYHLINFSRIKLSDRKSLLEPSESQTFRRLLEQVAKYNQKYEKDKYVEQRLKREEQKFKKFDQVIEKQEREQKYSSENSQSDQESENDEFLDSNIMQKSQRKSNNKKKTVSQIDQDDNLSLEIYEAGSSSTRTNGNMQMCQFVPDPPDALFQKILYDFSLNPENLTQGVNNIIQNEENCFTFENLEFELQESQNLNQLNPIYGRSPIQPKNGRQAWMNLQQDMLAVQCQQSEFIVEQIRLNIDKRRNAIN